jgi:hypothetical protein
MCPTTGAARARYTRGSIEDGPGVIISRIGGASSPIFVFDESWLMDRNLDCQSVTPAHLAATNFRVFSPTPQPTYWLAAN